MLKFSGTILYKDGREEPYETGGAALAEWEGYAARHGYPLTPRPELLETFPVKTWQMYLAYSALGVEEGFDTWRRTVSDVDSDNTPEPVVPFPAEVTAVP